MKEQTLQKYLKAKQYYDEGMDLNLIVKQLKIGKTRFQQWLKTTYGYVFKYNHLPKYEEGKKKYLEGQSITSISKELKISGKRFSTWLKQQGVIVLNPSKKYYYNENYFETIDNEHKAYWLGFLYADGCVVSKNKRHSVSMDLSVIDKNHIEKFKHDLNSNNPIYEGEVKLENKIYTRSRFSVYGNKICNDLIDKGCVPNKSLILKFPTEEQVPRHLIRHFIRGYIDGDGSIMLSTNKKFGRMSVIGTKDFLIDLIDTMNWRRNNFSTEGLAYSINYTGSYVKDYLDCLYKDCTIYLDRKYIKYLEICRLNSTTQKN